MRSLPTGLTKELIDQHGVPLDDAIAHLRAALPPHAVLVGRDLSLNARLFQSSSVVRRDKTARVEG